MCDRRGEAASQCTSKDRVLQPFGRSTRPALQADVEESYTNEMSWENVMTLPLVMCRARPEAVEAPATGPLKPEPGQALEAASPA
jgi:hypothetical protein